MTLVLASATMESVPVSYPHIRQALRVNGESLYQVNDVSSRDTLYDESCRHLSGTQAVDPSLLFYMCPLNALPFVKAFAFSSLSLNDRSRSARTTLVSELW